MIPGCAETFESESEHRDDRSKRFVDRHQKVRQFREGDVLALPAGFTLWFYNNGEERLETVALLDTSNEINQLDRTFRVGYLTSISFKIPAGLFAYSEFCNLLFISIFLYIY